MRTQQEGTAYEPGGGPSLEHDRAGTWILNFPASRTLRNKFLFLFIYLFIYLFLAVLGLHCCARAFSSCGEWGLLFVAVCGLLIVVASLVVEYGL